MFALFEPSTGAVGKKAIDRTAQAKEQEHTAEECQRKFEQGKECFQYTQNNFHSGTALHKGQRSPKGMEESNNNAKNPKGNDNTENF